MNKTKLNNYLPVIHFLKLISFTIAILSALLCWMFSVSATVVTGTIEQATETTSPGIQLAWNISSYLAQLSFFSFIVGILLAILYFMIIKKTNKKSSNEISGLIIFTSILVILTVFLENILQRLIINNLG